jgi:hypothetical protein
MVYLLGGWLTTGFLFFAVCSALGWHLATVMAGSHLTADAEITL